MIEIKISVDSVKKITVIKSALETYKDVLQRDLERSNYNYGEVKRITDNELKNIGELLNMLKDF